MSYRDLLGDGAKFTIKSNFQEHNDDDELFPELMTGEDGISFDSDAIVSPWDRPFAELIPLMTNIGNKIYKKIVKPSIDEIEIKGRCRVTIDYNAYYEQQAVPFDSTSMRGCPLTFITNDGNVLLGLEYAVLSMKRGEEAQFILPYELLYGEQGCEPRIKRKSDALFVIRVIKFSEVGDEEATDNVAVEDKRKYKSMIGRILDVKTSGIDHFRQGAYVKAASAFHKAINSLEMCQLADEAEEKEQQEHLIMLYINVMTCYNKIDKPRKVCSAYNDLKRLTNVNMKPKALYHYGKALTALGEYDRAKEALKSANRLKPNDKEIIDQLKVLEQKHNNFKNTETNLWRKAFGNDEEPVNSQGNFEVSDSFKAAARDLVTTFQKNQDQKEMIPPFCTKGELAYIKELIKDFQMKLVIQPEPRGKQSFYLTKMQ